MRKAPCPSRPKQEDTEPPPTTTGRPVRVLYRPPTEKTRRQSTYIEETTIKERIAISNAITPIFVDLERAENLLDTIQDECFEFKGGITYLSANAKWVYDMVCIVNNILCDAIAAFYLTIGYDANNCAEYYFKNAQYAETVLKCEETLNRIRDVEQSLPEDRRRRVLEIRKKVDDMKDEDALPILESLLKEARNG